MAINVYKLEHDMYFIGRSEAPKCEWTTLHKPIPVSEKDADSLVISYMEQYGIENVRGGSYSEVKLSEKQRTKIEKHIRGNARIRRAMELFEKRENPYTHSNRRRYKYWGQHNVDDVGCECSYCDVMFDSIWEYTQHVKQYGCDAEYGYCYYCMIGFYTEEQEKEHECTPQWDCDECNYRFETKEELVEHECKDESLYCHTCNLTFNTQEELFEHRKS